MHTKFFSVWPRLAAVVLLLLTTFTASPVQADAPVPGGIIAVGTYHTCALRPDGSIDCWGWNVYGQAEDQSGPYTQVTAGGNHTCALTPSGAVDCWGGNEYGQAEDQAGPYTQVSAGVTHTCALTPAGAADCWGDNFYSQAGDHPGPYTQVSAGRLHTCALTSAGPVDCWGDNGYYQSIDQPGSYTQVGTGSIHSCALTSAGAVECWGDNFNGQAENQPGPYIQMSTAPNHSCALTSAGVVECWGDNYYSQAENHPGPYGPYNPNIDTTPPGVTVTGVIEGSTYILGAVPQAGCSTTDEGSGVAVEASLSLSGGNTLGVGTFTATCSGALDNAGNSGNTAVVSYNVTFQFTGFLAPVDNLPVLNIARAGQVIPLKWRLTDASGTPIPGLTDATVTAASWSCEDGDGGDSIEAYAGSSSGLQYLGEGYYQWNWKTSKSYTNSCKLVSLDLGEGAGNGHTALFQFK